MNGSFLTIEGIDGSGKTTAIPHIEKMLINNGYNVLVTKDPGGTILGNVIRNVIMSNKLLRGTSALLHLASRHELINSVIVPAMRENKVVISDRFYDSTYAYQGNWTETMLKSEPNYSMNSVLMPDEVREIDEINEKVIIIPKHTILFDIDVITSVNRLSARSHEINKYDTITLALKENIINRYRDRARLHPDRISVVDANGSIESVLEAVSMLINKWYPSLISN